MKVTAAVARTPAGPFSIEELSLEEPRADEVRIKIVATGLCHTDIVVRDQIIPTPLPLVLGHEGAGIVDAVGSAVVGLEPGDHVVLGFAACRECAQCTAGEPAYCDHFTPLNFGGAREDGSRSLTDESDTPIGSHFFGQSSFADHCLTAAKNVVKVPHNADLELLGPLGCGIMTGAGAILKALKVEEGHAVLISGGGPVGLSAVMAAGAAGAATIILVDPIESRRAMAVELGATHAIDPGAGNVAEQVRGITARGVDRALDTSGAVLAIEAMIGCLAPRAKIAMVGVPRSLDATVAVPILGLLQLGASICGVTEGDADPRTFVPELIGMYLEGRFPFDKLITIYPIDQINQAVADQHAGKCVKAVLRF